MNNSLFNILKIPITRYKNNEVIMDIKWQTNSDIGWCILGNHWLNIFYIKPFEVSYTEIVKDGWIKQ